MSKLKKEVSDKVVVALLVAAVIVSILGVYVVYDYSNSYEIESEQILEDHTTGSVILNVVENPDLKEVDNNKDI